MKPKHLAFKLWWLLAFLGALLMPALGGSGSGPVSAHGGITGFVPSLVTQDVIPTFPSAPVDKTLHVPTVLPKLDLVIAVDTSGSMDDELTNLKANINAMINALVAAGASDLAIAVVSFEDYPATYNDDPPGTNCGYSATYGSATSGDLPYRVGQPVSTDLGPLGTVQTAVNALVLRNGEDFAQDYARVMWESSRTDAAPGQPALGYRAGAQKILLMFGDDVPHACDLNGPEPGVTSKGIDPGRDSAINTADDLDIFAQSIPAMNGAGVTLVHIHSGATSVKPLWDTYAQATGGTASQINPNGTIPGGVSLSQLVLDQIAAIEVDVSITRNCPAGADVRFS
ncbi:MAG: hypothetical protein ACRDG5_07390, partial [Anaerolineales bacterium]